MVAHLIVAEHDGKHLKKATLSAITAAKLIPGQIHGLVIGKDVKAIADDFAAYVGKVIVVEHANLAHALAQPYAKVVAEVARSIGATHVWAASSAFGKDLMPRVAEKLDAGMASDVLSVVDDKTFTRPMFAGDLIATVELTTAIKVMTPRATEFAPAPKLGGGEVTSSAIDPGSTSMTFVSFDAVKSERPELTEARVVISGGRGLKGPEGFKELVEPLADLLNGAIGASRAVCDAGWVPNDWQVGQTGKVVAPELYIAVGISGAIQHVAGMKGSKVIVAINKDAEAPIFQIANYGIVGDVFTIVPQLIAGIKALKNS
jgi:electron transfer flavoprotein alpha subunit